MTDPSIPSLHDRFFRESFARKEVARGFLREYLPPALVRRLDLDTLQIAKNSFIEKELREHFSDLLYTMRYRDKPLYVYLLFEHKSYPWPWIALQLLSYMVRIWTLHRQQHPEANKIPPIFPLVLYHGQPRWRAAANFQAIVEGLDGDLQPFVPEFRYRLYDLSRWDDQEIRGEVLSRLVLLALKHIFDGDAKSALREILPLIQEVAHKETALQALEALLRYFVQATQQLGEEDVKELLRLTSQGDDVMQTFIDRYIEEGERRGMQKGFQKGRQEGIQEGEQKGMREGEQKGEAAMLLRLLELKFGVVSAQDRRRIESADAQTLLLWSERVLNAESVEQVLG